jgi:hypothetical protein
MCGNKNKNIEISRLFFFQGCQLAVESYISEKNMVTYPTEITFSEVHGGSSQ